MKGINSNHLAWKDMVRKERHGLANSLTKGLNMDIIGSVQLNNQDREKVFHMDTTDQKRFLQSVEALSPQEKKVKLLEFLNQQRRIDINNESFDDSNKSKGNSMMNSAAFGTRIMNGAGPQNALQVQKRYQAGGVNFPPYGLHPSSNQNIGNLLGNQTIDVTPQSLGKSESQLSFLPSLKKNYYLAHSIDLTQPDFVNVQVNKQERIHDDIYNDNQKDNMKIVNRSMSPEELANARIYNSVHINPVHRRNIEVSKELPFNNKYYTKEKELERTIQIKMERGGPNMTLENSRRQSIGIDSQKQQQSQLFPMIKSSSLAYLNQDQISRLPSDYNQYKKDQMQQLLQPLKKDVSFTNSKTYGRLEKEIQKQVEQSKAQGFNTASINTKVQINHQSKYKQRNNVKNRYASIDAIREESIL
eukprot:403358198